MKITDLYSKEWHFLIQMVENGKLPHAILMSGQKGIGKYLFAERFVNYLLCESDKKPCGKCQGCLWFLKNQHPDFKRVLPAILQPEIDSKKNPSPYILVEQLRALSDFLCLSTHRQGLRIVLIYPAEAMNINAANAILKSLEEPISNTLFLLITNQKERLLPTIKSRCQELHFQTPNFENALNYLIDNKIEKEKATLALSFFSGAPILAETELKNGFLNKEWLKELLKILNNGAKIDPVLSAKIFDKMLRDKHIDLQRLTDAFQKWLVDLILLKFTQKNRFFIQSIDTQKVLNTRLSTDKILRFYPQFLVKKQQLAQPLNPKLFLESLFLQYRALFL